MRRAARPGLDPKPLSPSEIADSAEAGVKERAGEGAAAKKRAAAAVERAVEKVEKTGRMVSKNEFHKLFGFDRHTIDDWIDDKGMPAEKVGEEYRIDLRAAWKWREEYIEAQAIKKAGGVGGPPAGFMGKVWLDAGKEIKAMKDYADLGEILKTLAHIEDQEAAFERAMGIVRQSVMAIAERMTRDMAGFPEDRVLTWRKNAKKFAQDGLAEADRQIKDAFREARK